MDNTGFNPEDDYEVILVNEDLQFVRKRGTSDIVSANVKGHYVSLKDFDEQLKMLAHATQRKYNFWGIKQGE